MFYFLAVGGRRANCNPKAPQGFVAKVAAAAITLAVVSLPTSLQAQTYTWGGTGSTTASTDYNLGTNWSNPPAGAPPVNAGQAAIFSSTGKTSVFVSAGPITPNSWTFDATSQSYTITGHAVNFNGAGPNLVNNASAGQAISISNIMNGSTLVQAGASTLTLGGTNTFTSTNISAGTLALTGIGSVTGTVNVSNAAATFDISATVAGASITDLTGAANSHVTLGTQTLILSSGGGAIFGGIVQGTGGLFLGGGLQALTGVNTYTGNTTIFGGTLTLSGSGSIAASTLVTVSTGGAATFDISATSGASVKGLAGAASGVVALGNQTLTITNASLLNQFFGAINGAGGLTIAGGTQALGGASGYTGVTTINSGATLIVFGTGSIGSSSKVVNNGALDVGQSGTSFSITSLAGTSSTASVFLGSNTLTITNANDTFAGAIHGTGSLTLNGGFEFLTGTSNYTGATTVNGGTLAVNGSIASSAVTVNSGGTLTGTGQVGATQINASALLAPGGSVPGQSMTLASLAFQSGALYAVAVNPATASFANVTGNATPGGAKVIASFSSGRLSRPGAQLHAVQRAELRRRAERQSAERRQYADELL
jgi:autotransporter-associated beta strand protein